MRRRTEFLDSLPGSEHKAKIRSLLGNVRHDVVRYRRQIRRWHFAAPVFHFATSLVFVGAPAKSAVPRMIRAMPTVFIMLNEIIERRSLTFICDSQERQTLVKLRHVTGTGKSSHAVA